MARKKREVGKKSKRNLAKIISGDTGQAQNKLTAASKKQEQIFNEVDKHLIKRNVLIKNEDIDTSNTPFQFRIVKPDLSDMKTSIGKHGQVFAGAVRKNKNGKYTLIYGHSRQDVCAKLKKDYRADVYSENMPDELCKELGIVENVQRNDMTTADMIALVETYRRTSKLSAERIADIIGKGRTTVFLYQALAQRPDLVKMVDSNMLGISDAGKLIKKTEKEQEKEIQTIKTAHKQNKKEGKETKPIKLEKTKKKPFQIDKKKKKIRIAGIVKDLDDSKEVIAMLKEYIEQLKAL